MNIVFDLDGTLIDSKMRLYKLFQYLVPSSQFSYDQYWELKQNKISNEMILLSKLGYDQKNIERFVKEWMDLIESQEFLALDKSFPGLHAALASLKDQADLYICTSRQFRQPVLEQMEKFHLLPFFKQIMITEQMHAKETLITNLVTDLSDQDWMVGDTGHDIHVGKTLNMKTCGVLSGFMNENKLREYDPDLVIDSAILFPRAYLCDVE